MTDTVPMRIGRKRTVLRLSWQIDDYGELWVVWSPRLQRVGVIFADPAFQFFRLGTWPQFVADPFAGLERVLSGEARPTSG